MLVVDDDEQYLKLTTRVLSGAGYDVVARLGGFGTSSAVASERPDMLLMDVDMPALDGDRLATLIQRSNTHVPILVLHSGMDPKTLAERGLACGATATISKGQTREAFLRRIAQLFGDAPAAPPPESQTKEGFNRRKPPT